MDMIQTLAQELNKDPRHVENVVRLLDEGNTIPFIARYRKELHGAMDDTSLRTLEERLQYLRGLEERRDTVKKSIEEQGKLTEELAAAIDSAQTLAEVEDLYRPYKQKRRTRATVAREKGLEPLAALLFAQERDCPRPEDAAAGFIDSEKGVETAADALQGANDIIAEWISDDAAVRKSLRELLERRGTLRSLAATEEDSVYRLYYDFEQSLSRLQGHQILAINRGEKEEKLKVTVLLDRELALPLLRRAVVKPGSAAMEFVKAAAEDAYDRLIFPSLEREMRTALTEKASEGAIGQFALNLKPLLMQPPVKGKVTMGLDPGYRMGCKVAVVDGTGKVLDTAVVYPTYGERQKNEAIAALSKLIAKHGVEHIAIGNGTASRETEQMAVELIRKVGGNVSYMIVSEAGASVYSASKLAAEEVLLRYSAETGAEVFLYRLPHIYGKWSRPDYNSAVATFCHRTARELPVTIQNPGQLLHLAYVDDVVEEVLRCLAVDVVHLGEGRDRPVQHRVAVGLDVLDGVAALPARVLTEEAVQWVLHRVSRRVPGDILPQRVTAHQHHGLVGAVVAHKLGSKI